MLNCNAATIGGIESWTLRHRSSVRRQALHRGAAGLMGFWEIARAEVF